MIWRGRTIYGLDGTTRRVRWRCEANTHPPADEDQGPAWGLLRTPDPGFRPRLVCRYADQASATVCLQARATDPAGVYLPPEPTPLEPFATVDPAWYRTLPWARGDVWLGPYSLIPCALFGLALAYLALRRRWRTLAAVVAIDLLVIGLFAVHAVGVEGARYPEERYAWAGWYWLLYLAGLFGLVPLVLVIPVAALVNRARRRGKVGTEMSNIEHGMSNMEGKPTAAHTP